MTIVLFSGKYKILDCRILTGNFITMTISKEPSRRVLLINNKIIIEHYQVINNWGSKRSGHKACTLSELGRIEQQTFKARSKRLNIIT